MIGQERTKPLYQISGEIVDQNTQDPLEDATIVFKNIESNGIEFGGISDKNGKFSVRVSKGMYNVHIEYFSYKSKKLNISDISRDFDIGLVGMEIDTNYLDQIDVVAERKTVKIKPNKIEYNIDKDISTTGRYASEILHNIPSVSVDADGIVSLRGQSKVTVMIDGKISVLGTQNALKSLPAGSIEKIEVITNPSARYRATGLSVINIILKKGTNEGLNASVTNSLGYKDYYGGLLTLNHKSDKINFYTNTAYFHRNPIKVSTSENKYFNNLSDVDFVRESSRNDNEGKGFYTTIGMDYNLSSNSTFGGRINYQNINNNSDTETVTDFLDINNVINAENNRNHQSLFDNEILEFTLEYRHLFGEDGKNIASYFTLTKDIDTYNNSITNSNSNFIDEDYVEKNKLSNAIFDLTFYNPIKDQLSYEIGYSGEFGNIPFTISNNNSFGDVDYKENIHAFFVEFENELDNWSYNLGIRAEFAESEIDHLATNSGEKKTFNDLFPSLTLNYGINENQNLSLSFGKNIFRPTYFELKPFEQKISEISSYVGNENLDPVYISSFDLSYLLETDNATFSSALFYNLYNDYWQDVVYETGEIINGIEKIIATPFNVGKVKYYGMNLTTVVKPFNNLNLTGNILLYNFDQNGAIDIVDRNGNTFLKTYDYKSFNGTFSLAAQIQLNKSLEIQSNLFHKLISKGSYSTLKDNTYASFSINKDLFNNNGSIGLIVDDIFKSNRIRRNRFDSNYLSKSLIKDKNRTIILSFTYRFNQKKAEREIDFDKKINDPNY
jgi:hypothetical protein